MQLRNNGDFFSVSFVKLKSIIKILGDNMNEKKNDKNKEQNGWYSEPHTNHVTQTKKESILSEVLGDK